MLNEFLYSFKGTNANESKETENLFIIFAPALMSLISYHFQRLFSPQNGPTTSSQSSPNRNCLHINIIKRMQKAMNSRSHYYTSKVRLFYSSVKARIVWWTCRIEELLLCFACACVRLYKRVNKHYEDKVFAVKNLLITVSVQHNANACEIYYKKVFHFPLMVSNGNGF